MKFYQYAIQTIQLNLAFSIKKIISCHISSVVDLN